jgi:thiol-disulfide isomerase/thioredoxin
MLRSCFARRGIDTGLCLLLVGTIGAGLGTPPAAAQRCVLAEDFTAIWCIPCIDAGLALDQLEAEYPGQIAVLQIHVSDAHTIPWGTARFNSYPDHASIPDVWFDGVLQKVGANPQVYWEYLEMFSERQSVPTDVTVEIGGEQVSGPTFTFQVRVCLAPGGVPKPMRVYLVRALDHYPAGGAHYRNCLRQAAPEEDIDLAPGQCQVIERTMTFESTSWSQPNNIRMLAWAQVPADSGVREVYQARMISWPFEPLPPLYDAGDLNCDGTIDFVDINPFVLYLTNNAAWQTEFPGCPPELGDINGDGTYGQASFGDINPFVALLAGM